VTQLSLLFVAALMTMETVVAAQPVPSRVVFAGGTVTVMADDVRASDLLVEWARTGNVEIQGADLLTGRRITVNVNAVSEDEALLAVIGDAFSFAGVMRDPVEGASRYARLILRPSGVTAPSATSTSGPPEARYSYGPPPHAVSTTDILLTDAAPRSPTFAAPAIDPEARYDYGPPGRSYDPRVEATAPGVVAGPTRSSADRDPEAQFEYSLPRRMPELLAAEVSIPILDYSPLRVLPGTRVTIAAAMTPPGR
jgi:hypothetical protein